MDGEKDRNNEYEKIVKESSANYDLVVESIRPEPLFFALQIGIVNRTRETRYPQVLKAYYITRNRKQFDGNAVGTFISKDNAPYQLGEILPSLSKTNEFHFYPHHRQFHAADLVIVKIRDADGDLIVAKKVGRTYRIEEPLRIQSIKRGQEKRPSRSKGCLWFFVLLMLVLIIFFLI